MALTQDLRFGVRLLWRDRTFTLAALLTLGVCIAANAAMFSVVRSVLMKPLPFPESERVVLQYNSYPNAGAPRVGNAVPDYFDRLTAVPAMAELAAFRRESVTFGDETGAERLVSLRATPSFFKLVRVQPIQGRLFTDAEGEPGQEAKVLLSSGFWQRKFGGKPVVGQTLRLNGRPFDIVGVLPAEFTFLQKDIDIFAPASFTPDARAENQRHSNNWQLIGRLAPGATLDQVRQQVIALNAANDERFPQFKQLLKDANFQTVSVMLADDVVRDVKSVLYLLWYGVLFVLVIGTANIANLVMVRSSGRTREMATRHAIGGDLGRLARQLLTETTLLAVTGGLLGLGLGWAAVRFIASLNLDQVPRGYEITLDGAGIALTLGLAMAAGLLIGVAPVLRLWRMNLNVELREESRGGTAGRRANLVRRVLATVQIALALLLLVGAGLLFASFRAVMRLDLGFQPAQVHTSALNLPGSAYPDAKARIAFEQRALTALRALPGVEAAGGTTLLPFSGNVSNNVIMAEGYVMKPGESLIAPSSGTAAAGYFEAMHIPIVKGRAFDARDTAEATKVVIVDEKLASKFWPDQDPLGRRLYFPDDPKDLTKITPNTRFLTVVGVTANVEMFPPGVGLASVGTYYQAFEQNPPGGLTFTVRTRAAAPGLAQDVRKVIRDIDPQLAVFRQQPMQQWIDDALIGRRIPMLIALGFGGVALLLAAIGVYGVLAYSVAQRKRELGVRMALGGSAGRVFGLVLTDGLKIAGAGLAVGLAGSFFVGQIMKSQLFAVSPMNPIVLILVSLILALVALVACAIPALRASRINPIIVLGK
jgi:predicted permease